MYALGMKERGRDGGQSGAEGSATSSKGSRKIKVPPLGINRDGTPINWETIFARTGAAREVREEKERRALYEAARKLGMRVPR